MLTDIKEEDPHILPSLFHTLYIFRQEKHILRNNTSDPKPLTGGARLSVLNRSTRARGETRDDGSGGVHRRQGRRRRGQRMTGTGASHQYRRSGGRDGAWRCLVAGNSEVRRRPEGSSMVHPPEGIRPRIEGGERLEGRFLGI